MTAAERRAVLVTGANGFVGKHLTHELVEHGFDVVAVAMEERSALPDLVSDYVSADLSLPWPALPPVDGIVHLAGLSAVGPSFDHPQEYLRVNGSMIIHLAEWSGRLSSPPRSVVVSSGAVYDPAATQPLTEASGVSATSPYVVSKLLVESLTAYYRNRGHDMVVVRPFNHIGPGQGPGFLVPDLARQLGQVVGSTQPLEVGELGTSRDYTDVRDVTRAYRLLLESDLRGHGLFNVCSGRSRTGRQLLSLLVQAAGHDDIDVRVDPSRLRPQDPSDIRGSAARLTEVTGWLPTVPVEQSVADFVADLRDEVRL